MLGHICREISGVGLNDMNQEVRSDKRMEDVLSAYLFKASSVTSRLLKLDI